MRSAKRSALLALLLTAAAPGYAEEQASASPLGQAATKAQAQLRQTFTNLSFRDFEPAPVKGQIYQANSGGRLFYYAPESDHLLFAAIYDRNGVNVTALAQDKSARARLAALDRNQALVIGPPQAPEVIEFTDPDCPYCRALDRFWASRAAEGKPVRRLIFFVSGIHPQAAAKAEHILCAADKPAAFKAIYGGAEPAKYTDCMQGHAQLAAHSSAVQRLGVSGTPTLIIGDKLISGFQQAEIAALLDEGKPPPHARE